jgi:hypothetical protein
VRGEIERESWTELAEHRLEYKTPTLVYGRRLADIHLGGTFDHAWALAVLFHLIDEHMAECFAFVREHLSPEGSFLRIVNPGRREPKHRREGSGRLANSNSV